MYGVSVPTTKLYKAKCYTKGGTKEKHGVEFVILRYYTHMVLKINRGSIAKVKSKLLHTQAPPTFERIYISFQGSTTSFINGRRPFIGFNRCHLKRNFQGVLLNTIALYANL